MTATRRIPVAVAILACCAPVQPTNAVEPFVNLRDTDWGGEAGLGQNRVSVGLGWRVNDKLELEAGYLNQYVSVNNADDRVNHLAAITFKARF